MFISSLYYGVNYIVIVERNGTHLAVASSLVDNLHPLPAEERNFQRHTWQTPAFHRGSSKTMRVPQDGLLWRSEHDAR